MSQKVVAQTTLYPPSFAKNQLVNGGFDFWQRDPNWNRYAFADLMLQLAMTNVNNTFTTKVGASDPGPNGSRAFPGQTIGGWVKIDDEIISYSGYNTTTHTFSVTRRGLAQVNVGTQLAVAHAVNALVNPVFTRFGTYTADKWRIGPNYGTVIANERIFVYRETNPANIDTGSRFSAGIRWIGGAYSAGGVGLSPSPVSAQLFQHIEHFDYLRNQEVSLTARVKCATPNIVRAYIQAQLLNGEFAMLGYSNQNSGIATSFQTLSIPRAYIPQVFKAPIAGTEQPIVGIRVGFEFAAGATSEIWLDNAMLTLGGISSYVPEDYTSEILRCMRWFEKVYTAHRGGSTVSGGRVGVFVRFMVPKPPLPAIISRLVRGSWAIENASGNQPLIDTGASFTQKGVERDGVFAYVVRNADNAETSYAPNSMDDYIEVEVTEA